LSEKSGAFRRYLTPPPHSHLPPPSCAGPLSTPGQAPGTHVLGPFLLSVPQQRLGAPPTSPSFPHPGQAVSFQGTIFSPVWPASFSAQSLPARLPRPSACPSVLADPAPPPPPAMVLRLPPPPVLFPPPRFFFFSKVFHVFLKIYEMREIEGRRFSPLFLFRYHHARPPTQNISPWLSFRGFTIPLLYDIPVPFPPYSSITTFFFFL